MPKSAALTRKPPPVPPAPVTRLVVEPVSRWAWPLIIGTTIAAAGMLTALIVVLKHSPRQAEAAARPAEERPTTEKVKPTPAREPASVVEEETVRPRPMAPAPVPEPARRPVRPPESVLTLVGGLTSAHLYQSYLNIGLLADSVAKGVYKTEEGKELLETVTKIMDTVERQLAQLPEAELTPDEKKRLEKVRPIVSLLRNEVKELRTYWDTGDDEYVRRFHKIHKDVWAELEKLLGDG